MAILRAVGYPFPHLETDSSKRRHSSLILEGHDAWALEITWLPLPQIFRIPVIYKHKRRRQFLNRPGNTL